MSDNKLNQAVNFFIGVTLLNETIDEVLETKLFQGKDKQKGKNLLNYFSPIEEELFRAFRVNNNVEEELEFQITIKNMGSILSEVVDLNAGDIQIILDGIKKYKEDIKIEKEKEITSLESSI